MDDLETGKDGGACAVFDGFGEDAVAVIVINNYQIVVASAGWGRKSACVWSLKICPVGSRRAA